MTARRGPDTQGAPPQADRGPVSLKVGSFVPARVGPDWAGLPLPALIIDGEGRIAAMNDLAEPFLNLSARSALGLHVEGREIRLRLRIVPPLGPLVDCALASNGALTRPAVRLEIGDRAGGHDNRMVTLHLGPVADPAGAVMVLIAPGDSAGRAGQGAAVRSAVRSAVGMAEMLAHEIKNPLAGIRGAAQLLAMNLLREDRDLADLIVEESRRIVKLLEQVERFGDTTAPRLAPVNLHDVLERVRRSAAVGFARDLRIATNYDPSLPPALGDADQLAQVCMNLIRNAAEALSLAGKRDGEIRLRSFYDGRFRSPPSAGHPDGRSLPLQVEVEDDGPGIPPAIADEVFEPFVSGRENGTGLGLALVSKILTDHDGWLQVESRPGRTVFRFSLPKA